MRKLKLLLLLVGVLMALPVMSRDFSYEHEGHTITYTIIDQDAKTCMTKAGSSAAPGNAVEGSLTLPANPVDGTTPYTLIEIGDYSFAKCGSLSAISIPNTVTTIGVQAFRSCTGLTSLIIPNSVKTIGEMAFAECSGLTWVIIGNSVETIGDRAFYACLLDKLAYPNTIKDPTSEDDVLRHFHVCYPPEGVIIENGIVYGPNKSVIYFVSPSLEGEFNIPNSVKTISFCAFFLCNKLTSVVIPNSVEAICDYAFAGCGLSWVVIPNSVETIGNYAFSCSDLLGELIIPNSVKTIGFYAFDRCNKLTSVVIGNSVETIGEGAFWNCSDLTSVVIGNSVETIGEEAFSGCYRLEYVYSVNPEAPFIDHAFPSDLTDAILYVPKGSVNKYANWFYAFLACRELDSLLGLTISEQNVRVEVGEESKLTVTAVSYAPSSLDPFIVAGSEHWMSDNEDVATVENGVVKAIGGGTATITYSVEDRFGYIHSVECEVKVTYMRGDANGDNSLAVNDVILTARGVVNDLDPALVMEAADMNGDDALTVGDLTQVVNAVISYEIPAKAAGRNYQRAMEAGGMVSPLLLTQNGDEINVAFDGDGRFTAIQFDVVGDDGLSVTSVTLSGAAMQSHSVANHRLETGAMRMLAYGTETFATNDTFATIHLESADIQPCTLKITNVMGGDFNGNLYRLPDCGINVMSQAGVADVTNGSLNIYVEGRTLIITSGEDTTVAISDMKGITTTLEIEAGVTRHTLTTAGVYIVNNHKIMIR